MKRILVVGDVRDISLLLNDLVREGHYVEWWGSYEHAAGNLAAGKGEFDLIILCMQEELEDVAEVAFDMTMSAVNVPRMVAVWGGAMKESVDVGAIDKIVPDFSVSEILSVFQPTAKENVPT